MIEMKFDIEEYLEHKYAVPVTEKIDMYDIEVTEKEIAAFEAEEEKDDVD